MKDYGNIEQKLQESYDGLLSAVKAPDIKIDPDAKISRRESVSEFFGRPGMQIAAAALAVIFTVGGIYSFIFYFGSKNPGKKPIPAVSDTETAVGTDEESGGYTTDELTETKEEISDMTAQETTEPEEFSNTGMETGEENTETEEEITEPETEAEAQTEPPTEAEEPTEPPTETEELTEPPTETEELTEPPTEAEELTEPPTEAEELTEPLTEDEETTEPETTEPDTESDSEEETEFEGETDDDDSYYGREDINRKSEDLYDIAIDGIRYADRGDYCEVVKAKKSLSGEVTIPSYVRINGKDLPVKSIAAYAFLNCCDITGINMPDDITSIGEYAFAACIRLANITVPRGVTVLKIRVFAGCYGLTDIIIPDNVTTIEHSAFDSCEGLKSVTIGSGVTSISYDAFASDHKLETLVVSKNNKVYHSDGDCIIETGSKKLVIGAANCIIPDDGSVTTIGKYAFLCNYDRYSITIPVDITEIETGAFYMYSYLKEVYYTGTVEQFHEINIHPENENITDVDIICSDGVVPKKPDEETGWEEYYGESTEEIDWE